MENGELYFGLHDTLALDGHPIPGNRDFLKKQQAQGRENIIITDGRLSTNDTTEYLGDAIKAILTRSDSMRSQQNILGDALSDTYAHGFGCFYTTEHGEVRSVLADFPRMSDTLAGAFEAAGMGPKEIAQFFRNTFTGTTPTNKEVAWILRNARVNPFDFMVSKDGSQRFNVNRLYYNSFLANYDRAQEKEGRGIIGKDLPLAEKLLKQRGLLDKASTGKRRLMIGDELDISASVSDGGNTPVIVIDEKKGLVHGIHERVKLMIDTLLSSEGQATQAVFDDIFSGGDTITNPFEEVEKVIGKAVMKTCVVGGKTFTFVFGIDPRFKSRTIIADPQSSTKMVELRKAAVLGINRRFKPRIIKRNRRDRFRPKRYAA